MSSDLSYPQRRSLQDYHREWLGQADQHGLKIQQRECLRAQTSCLFVEPDAQAGVSNRGRVLRRQLAADGIALPSYGDTIGILVLLHGKNGRKEDLLPVAERFAAAGLRCVLPDMPAHGDNRKSSIHYATAPYEKGFANRVLQDARHVFAAPADKAALWGMSMGGAFAIEAAAEAPHQWQAMVIVASFDSLEGVIQDRLVDLPALTHKPLIWLFAQIVKFRDHFDIRKPQPVQWASRLELPVLVAHGTDDSLIRIKRGKDLFDAFKSKEKQWVAVPGGTHQNILVTDYPLYKIMSAWYLRMLSHQKASHCQNC